MICAIKVHNAKLMNRLSIGKWVVFQFEEASKEAADESTRPRPEGEEEIQDIQVTLKSDANPDGIRYLKV